MANRFYTFILVPHAEAKFRKIHFSKRTAIIVASFLGLMVLVAGLLTFHYWQFYGEMRDLRRLRMVNAELRRQNLDYEVSVEHLNNRVTSLQDLRQEALGDGGARHSAPHRTGWWHGRVPRRRSDLNTQRLR